MNTRRQFITKTATAALGSIALSGIASSALAETKSSKKVTIEQGDIVLFQGDSITDWGRDRNQNAPNNSGTLGSGYAMMAASGLLLKYAGKNLQIFNKGVSGNKVYQLAERWDADCLKIKPNVLSILIGVNDYWHTLGGGYKGTADVYATDYKKLVDLTKTELPNVKLIICEPFAVKGVKSVDDKWYPAFDEYRAAAKQLAEQYDAVFVPFQSVFDKALETAPGSYWTLDGVHPSVAGSQLMAHAWLEAVKG